MDHPQPPTPI
eukprot:CCRYP_001447-RB/>CCRYP_001447-RB protein AED:0.32 eAED:0.84 QI:35/-1/0/1/-1/0/1/73/10